MYFFITWFLSDYFQRREIICKCTRQWKSLKSSLSSSKRWMKRRGKFSREKILEAQSASREPASQEHKSLSVTNIFFFFLLVFFLFYFLFFFVFFFLLVLPLLLASFHFLSSFFFVSTISNPTFSSSIFNNPFQPALPKRLRQDRSTSPRPWRWSTAFKRRQLRGRPKTTRKETFWSTSSPQSEHGIYGLNEMISLRKDYLAFA